MIHNILPQILKNTNKEAYWKLKVTINTKHDVLRHRVFLMHNGFKEYPTKISCHTCKDVTYYSTLLPTSQANQKQVQCEIIHEKIFSDFQNHDIELELVTEGSDINMLVPINMTKIDMGSIFLHEEIPVVVALVQTTYHEIFSNTTQKKEPHQEHNLLAHPPQLILHISFSTKTPLTNIKKQIQQLEKLIKLFDF